jgi:RHS repeat-associated protein
MSTEYDAAGQRVAVTDALGRTTRFVYDAAGRMVETIHPDETADDADNPRTRYAYDALGRKVAETDEMGRITRYSYDRLSRLTQVVLPNPANGNNPELVDGQSPANSGTLVTRYDYDEQGNKTAQTDAEGRTTRWAYDKQGRQLSRTLPMGQVESFVYDANGQRVQHTTFNSEIIGAQYDNLGRPAQLSFPNNKLRSFQYTGSGQIAEINDGGLVYRFTYDSRDRLLSATDPFGRTLNYGYDAIGNRTELSSARQQVQYQYDVLNRLREMVATLGTNPPQTSSYSYDAVGNRAGMVHPNGTVVEYQYDVRNRLKTLIHKASQTAGAAILLSLSYSVDASGLRTQISETRPGTGTTAITRVTSYTYDAVKRLTREVVTGTNSQNRNSNWTYDKVGNRKTESSSGTLPRSQTYTYDANDRLISETGTQPYTYTYDAAGNILQKKQGTTVVADYTWDAEGRMTQAVTGSGASQKTIAYSYDANGIRRSQQISDANGSSRTEFLVDPNQAYAQVLEEWDANGNPLGNATLSNVYVYGDDLISQTLLAGDQISATSIYHYDGLGTTRALSAYNVDASGTPQAGHGAITDRYAYTAFGESDPAGSSGNTSGNTDNNYRYTGEQLDPNLGFYYLRARYMDARVGRFVGMDTFDGHANDPLSLHKYLANQDDPVNRHDPSGRESLINLTNAIKIIGIGSTSIHVGFHLAEGDYEGAARAAAEDVVYTLLGAAAAKPIAWLGKSAFNVFARAYRFKTARLILGAAHDSTVLRSNLIAVLGRAPWGHQAHHIVGKAYAEGRAAIRILERHRIDINSPLNGVFLPDCDFRQLGTAGMGAVLHCGPHNRKYARYVLAALNEVGGMNASKRQIINALSRVREELLAGSLRLNRVF